MGISDYLSDLSQGQITLVNWEESKIDLKYRNFGLIQGDYFIFFLMEVFLIPAFARI